MIDQKKLLQTLKDFPEQFSIDELMGRLILIEKVETGYARAMKGKSKTTEEAKFNLKKWLK